MRLLVLILLSFCYKVIFPQGAAANLPRVASGTICRLPDFPSEYIVPRNVDVWIPDGYDRNTKYAVIYMHDGQMLFDSTYNWNHQEWGVDETAGRLIAEKITKPFIVVGICNTGPSRHIEYCPQKPFNSLPSSYRDSLITLARRSDGRVIFAGEVRSDNYVRFIVNELKPYIDSAHSTFPDKDHTFIGGSSMGGLISLYAICEYPEVFGGAACLSTHWPVIYTSENNPFPLAILNYLDLNLPAPADHKIYFDYGTETLDAMYEPFQLRVDEIMKEKGYPEKNWETLKFPGEEHSEKAWRKRLEIPIKFLLGIPE
jgi:enterochelin esterase-like enzyme